MPTSPQSRLLQSERCFGPDGSFITSPEISQMFSEILGLCLAQYWIDLNRPDRFALVEFGPGKATLMLDILRADLPVKGFIEAAEIFLVRASSKLRRSKTKLSKFNVNWIDDDLLIPKIPTLLIANEFFDACLLTSIKENNLWYEIQVG